jgi:hypothetical protein
MQLMWLMQLPRVQDFFKLTSRDHNVLHPENVSTRAQGKDEEPDDGKRRKLRSI